MARRADNSVDWLLWQLADSAFPTGGFAHSGGLEAAYQNGEVRNRGDLREFLEAALEQAARGALPFVAAAFDGQFARADQLCEAFTTSHVANRASRLQGRAFLNAALRAFPDLRIDPPATGHLAPVSGALFAALGLDRLAALRLYLFTQLRGWTSAAVRLNIVGPLEAQSIQAALAPRAESLLHGDFALESAVQTAPILEIFQAGHDRLYSRLFQS